MARLNQVIAIEKSVKQRVNTDAGALHKISQKGELFNGLARTYSARDDGGEQIPPEYQRVQHRAEALLSEIAGMMSELFDVTATKDWTNTRARADVVVEGETLLSEVPATYLLFLEKNLDDLRTVIDKLPVLDPSYDWTFDANQGLFKTEPTLAQRTKKEQRPIVLYDATTEHPAQTQLITEDVVVGHWKRTLLSGALPEPRRKTLLRRVEALRNAVKFAREQANTVEADEQKVGEKLFGWLLRE
jgi:hypothetical protein